MMPDNTVLDLLQATNDGKPQDFKAAFDDVISTKISDAIDAKREAITNQMFASAEDEDADGYEDYEDTEIDTDENFDDIDAED